MKKLLTLVLTTAALVGPGLALAADNMGNMPGMDHSKMAAPMSEGVVKKIDKAASKVTISHGPLENLGMPAMTMVFRVKDVAWLDKLAAGDKIRFVAENVNGAYTVTQYELAK